MLGRGPFAPVSPIPPDKPLAASDLGGSLSASGQMRAIVAVMGATLCFAVAGAFVKAVSPEIPVWQVVFFRSVLAFVVLARPMWQGGMAVVRVVHVGWHVLRVGSGLVGMFAAFYGIAWLPFADVTALGFTMPLFLTVLSVPLLGETVGWRRALAVVVGFLGVLLIVRPGSAGSAMALGPALVVILGALAWAFSMVAIRRLGALGERNITIVFWFSAGGAVVAGLLMLPDWVTPTPVQALYLVGTGLVSGVAQLMMTQAYRSGETSVVAPFEYVSILWAVAVGWLVWGEAPDVYMLGGVAVLVASGLYILHREVVRRRQKPQAEPQAEPKA
jgi:drug/metabolite transporter (DMT)-like permease